ncbi:MAG: hypothetical protein AAGF77_07500 [Bacteroidota bacterium]
MRNYGIFIIIGLLAMACKSEPKTIAVPEVTPANILDSIAIAHGCNQWQKVAKIGFTFNVDREDSHFERQWVWKPKTNEVTLISGLDTLSYNRNTMDSTAYKTNAGFINDRYWLLAPFNLMWDRANFTPEYQEQAKAPISGESMQQLTIVYGADGGYTPGDAYDFYFGNDFVLQEWTFRKGNQKEASMSTTWENYLDTLGLKLARRHQKLDKAFELYLDGITVSLEE